MAWPPPTLPINRSDATPQQATHPADHNAANLAINDLVAKVSDMDLWKPELRVGLASAGPFVSDVVVNRCSTGTVPTARLAIVAVHFVPTVTVFNGNMSLSLYTSYDANPRLQWVIDRAGQEAFDGSLTLPIPANGVFDVELRIRGVPGGTSASYVSSSFYNTLTVTTIRGSQVAWI